VEWFRPVFPDLFIEIEYPRRFSWTSGTDSWVIYFFIVSMIAAMVFRRLLNVKVKLHVPGLLTCQAC
jgi:hypothetical protein